MSERVWTAAELLDDALVEELWSGLPLTTYCVCEDEWSDDAEAFVTPESCQCERRTIPCVRNALAAALGEPQIAYVDPTAPTGDAESNQRRERP